MSKPRAKNVDLLNDSPMRSIVLLTLPVIGSSLLQSLYNVTDTFWVSTFSSNAVAAVGAAGSFIWFTQSFMVMIRTGAQILVGQSFGRGDQDRADRLTAIGMQLSFFASILVAVLQLFFTPQLIGFIGLENPDTIRMAEAYLRISSFGLPFSYFAGVLTGVLSAVGNTRIAFRASAVGLVINMILDPLFILIFKQGASDTALATLIAQIVVIALMLNEIYKTQIFPTTFNRTGLGAFRKRYAREDYWEIFRLGIPSGLQTMLYSGISIFLSRIVAGFGEIEISAKKIGGQFENLAWTIAQAFGSSLNSFTAQNHAAGKTERLKTGYRAGINLSLIIGIIASVAMIIFPEQLLGIFFSNQAEIEAGARYMAIVGFSQIFQCVELMTTGAFSGRGNTLYPSIVISTLTVLRLPVALLLSNTSLGINGVWLAISVSSILKGIILWVSYEIQLKRDVRLYDENLVKADPES